MAVTEPPLQGVSQLADFVAESPFGEFGEHGGVAFPVDEGAEHRSAGDAGDLGCDRRQFQPGVLQQLLQPLDLTGPFSGEGCTGSGQISQLTNWLWWNERRTDQPVCSELG